MKERIQKWMKRMIVDFFSSAIETLSTSMDHPCDELHVIYEPVKDEIMVMPRWKTGLYVRYIGCVYLGEL